MKPAVGHAKWLVAALAIRRSRSQRYARPLHVTTKKVGLTVNSAPTKQSYAAAGTSPGSGGPSGSTKLRSVVKLRPPRPGSLASICRWLCPLVSARDEVSAFTIAVAAQYLSARRERPLVHIRTRICAGEPVPLKPATLLPPSPTNCRKSILKRLGTVLPRAIGWEAAMEGSPRAPSLGGESDEYVAWDAAYVLGSLSDADRGEYEAHLRDCRSCRESVDELSGMPALLGQLSADEVAAIDDGASETLLPPLRGRVLTSLLATVSRRRRVARVATWTMAAAAAVMVFGVLAGVQFHWHPTASVPRADASALAMTPVARTE